VERLPRGACETVIDAKKGVFSILARGCETKTAGAAHTTNSAPSTTTATMAEESTSTTVTKNDSGPAISQQVDATVSHSNSPILNTSEFDLPRDRLKTGSLHLSCLQYPTWVSFHD
jgi:hypothetical protein